MRTTLLLVLGLAGCSGAMNGLRPIDGGEEDAGYDAPLIVVVDQDSGSASQDSSSLQSEATAEADLPEASTSEASATWTLSYRGPGVGTVFEASASVGSFTGSCNGAPQQATVTASGSGFTVTPMAGCYEQEGDPCIYCGNLGWCASATPVALEAADAAPETWVGTCGLYTVVLRAE